MVAKIQKQLDVTITEKITRISAEVREVARSKSRPRGQKIGAKPAKKLGKTYSKKVLQTSKTPFEIEEEARIRKVKQRVREITGQTKRANSRSQSREDSANSRTAKSQKRLEKDLLGRNSRFGGTNSMYSSAQQSIINQKEAEKRGAHHPQGVLQNPKATTKSKIKQPILHNRRKQPILKQKPSPQ